MDNVEWSHADSYFLSFVSDDVEERYTENVYLDSLSVKQKFNPNHSYLSQLDVTYKTPDLMSHFLPP
ncbi:hypothetical protein OLD50_08520, partial [Streptococcus pneumoniae]|nr:hypothetical protein [Streptococcus pneumoniae]